jgi:hypothetical protein
MHLQVVHGILQFVLNVIHRADELQDGLIAQARIAALPYLLREAHPAQRAP